MSSPLQKTALTRVTGKLALFLLVVLLFEVFLIAVAPQFHSGSVLKIAKDCLLFRVRNDSWFYMAQADLAWREHPHAIYETVFFHRGIRFIYPPTSLLLYRLWRSAEWLHIKPFGVMNATLWLSLTATLATSGEFLLRLLPSSAAPLSKAERWKIRLLVCLLGFIFLPIINAYFLGQVQTLLNFLAVASVLLWMRGDRVGPGVLIGLTCWLKPQMALFLLWALLRRQWNFALSLGATVIVGLSLCFTVFGVHNTVEYAHVLSYLGRRGDALFSNQSLNGLLHRVMHVGSPVTWIYGYPPYNRTIYVATLISSTVTMLLALIVPAVRHMAGSVIDFLLFAMATTMASPIAWEHHYGVFFLVFLLWMPSALSRRRVFVALLAVYLLMTDVWAPLGPLMFTPWTFLISHVYFGGLILFLWTLFGMRDQEVPRSEMEARGTPINTILPVR